MNETAGASAGAAGGFIMIIWLALVVLMLASMWRIFTKAGKPGWWLILMFIPFVNIIIGILALVGLANNFGKGGGFVAGMIFLPIIFYPMLAFGSAQYQGSQA